MQNKFSVEFLGLIGTLKTIYQYFHIMEEKNSQEERIIGKKIKALRHKQGFTAEVLEITLDELI